MTKYEFANSLAHTSGNPDFLLHFHKDEDDDCYEQNWTKINAKVFRVVKQSCVVVVAAGTNRDVAAVVAVSVVAFRGVLSFYCIFSHFAVLWYQKVLIESCHITQFDRGNETFVLEWHC